jgi:nucleoside-diphosphate-sugar epimerase
VSAIAAGLGREARLFAVPRALLGAAAALTGGRARIAALYESLELDTTRIRSTLGWAPPYSFAQGVAETCRWFAAARG